MPTVQRRPYPPRRPRGLTEADAFAWHMPGDPPPPDMCWDWSAATNKGYGQFGIGSRVVAAHRASYRKFIGPITDGTFLLHSCDRPICVQPAHLSPGAPVENTAQCLERGRFHVGERCSWAKLTEADVRWIRESGMGVCAMAVILGVNHSTVSDIRSGKKWKHVH